MSYLLQGEELYRILNLKHADLLTAVRHEISTVLALPETTSTVEKSLGTFFILSFFMLNRKWQCRSRGSSNNLHFVKLSMLKIESM